MTCLKFKFENTKIMFPMSGEGGSADSLGQEGFK